MILCVCVYVDLHVSMGQFVCMSVISMYIYIHIYTYNICLVHSCHVQVQIFWLIYTHQNQSIFPYTHKTHIDSHTCVMKSSYFWGIQWWKKSPKIHANSLYDALVHLKKKICGWRRKIKASGGPAGRLAALDSDLGWGSVWCLVFGQETKPNFNPWVRFGWNTEAGLYWI